MSVYINNKVSHTGRILLQTSIVPNPNNIIRSLHLKMEYKFINNDDQIKLGVHTNAIKSRRSYLI